MFQVTHRPMSTTRAAKSLQHMAKDYPHNRMACLEELKI